VGNDPLALLEGMRGHGMGGGTFNPFAQMPGGMGNMTDPNAVSPESTGCDRAGSWRIDLRSFVVETPFFPSSPLFSLLPPLYHLPILILRWRT
jgi:hypothetical protein